MKKIYSIILTTSIFVLDMVYAYIVIFILKRLGIDIKAFNTTLKYICLILIYLSFMLIMFLIFRKTLIQDFKDYKNHFKEYLSFGAKYWILGIIIMIASNAIIYSIYPNNATNETLVQDALKAYPIYICFQTILFAPFTEELIFRKSLKGIFNSNFIYIIVSGLLFGYVHTLANPQNPMELLYIIPYGSVGAVFAYMYAKTKNIYVPMTFHCIHNTITVMISLLIYAIGGSLWHQELKKIKN